MPKHGLFYDESNPLLLCGMMFRDKSFVQAAVKDYSIRVARREYSVVESTPLVWKVKCRHEDTYNCLWTLRAAYKKNLNHWKITMCMGPHTCMPFSMGPDHANLDKNMVAAMLLGMVRQNPAVKPKVIQQLVKDRYGYDIDYMKA